MNSNLTKTLRMCTIPSMAIQPRHPVDASSSGSAFSMTAFDRFVPRRALDLLGATDVSVLAPGAVADAYVTIMFVDLRGFSTLSETMEPDSIFGLLNRWFGIVSPLVVAHGGYIDKYIGDAVMAVFPDCPDDALRCAIAIVRRIETVNAEIGRAHV